MPQFCLSCKKEASLADEEVPLCKCGTVLNALDIIRYCSCGKPATWAYTPALWTHYCDACVPRGCSCQAASYSSEGVPDELLRDEEGNLLPCVEYDNIYYTPDEMVRYANACGSLTLDEG